MPNLDIYRLSLSISLSLYLSNFLSLYTTFLPASITPSLPLSLPIIYIYFLDPCRPNRAGTLSSKFPYSIKETNTSTSNVHDYTSKLVLLNQTKMFYLLQNEKTGIINFISRIYGHRLTCTFSIDGSHYPWKAL